MSNMSPTRIFVLYFRTVLGPLLLLTFAIQEHFLEPSGLPEFSDASLLACHGLWTPADLHILAKADASVLPSALVKTLGVPD